MVLINCPACKKGASMEAPTCPHCGHPIKPPSTAWGCFVSGVKWLLIIGVVGFLLSALPLILYFLTPQ